MISAKEAHEIMVGKKARDLEQKLEQINGEIKTAAQRGEDNILAIFSQKDIVEDVKSFLQEKKGFHISAEEPTGSGSLTLRISWGDPS